MSSDSSEDEDLDKLREATASQFINDAMFNQRKSETCNGPQIQKLPSLRRCKDEDEQFNLFRVSPEFRGYVAKHLSMILDDVLNKKLRHKADRDDYTKPKRRKSGIKLFKNSPHYLTLESGKAVQKPPKKIISEEVDDDRFRSVAVSPEDILSRKETKHWSNRSKAPVYAYVQTKQGLILK